MSSPFPPDFDQLSHEEQVEYVLSADMTSDENCVDIPEWHREILEKQMARYEEVGMEGTPWEEFKQQLIEEGLFKLG